MADIKYKRMSQFSKDLVQNSFEPQHDIKWWLVAGVLAALFIAGIIAFA